MLDALAAVTWPAALVFVAWTAATRFDAWLNRTRPEHLESRVEALERNYQQADPEKVERLEDRVGRLEMMAGEMVS